MEFNQQLTTLVRQMVTVGVTPALMGEPGIGKSSFVEALAFDMNTRAFVLPCNQLADKSDLTGARLVPTPDGKTYHQVFYPHQVIREAVDYAVANPREYPILFLDEINRTTSDVTSGILTLVTLRRMGDVKLPDNVRVIVAGNDKGNVTTLDEASLSRFCIIHVEPDAPTLVNILGDTCNKWVRQVLNQYPKLVFQRSTPNGIAADGDDDDANISVADLFDAGEEMTQLTTPRTIENLSKWLNITQHDELANLMMTPVKIGDRETSMLAEVCESFTGNTAFTDQVVAAIADDLSKGVSTAINTVAVPHPVCYDGLKAATTFDQLQAAVSGLTPHEVVGSLLYALSERTDNSRLIEMLVPAISQFTADHMMTLANMISNKQADKGNIEAFKQIDTPVVASISGLLAAYQ